MIPSTIDNAAADGDTADINAKTDPTIATDSNLSQAGSSHAIKMLRGLAN